MEKQRYPSDVTDDEWAFIAPYLTLMKEEAPQREYSLRKVFNGLRWIVRTGAPWRFMPTDLPPWYTVYQQSQRWIRAGVFEAMVNDLRAVLRLDKGLKETPSAAIFDSRTLQSTVESGSHAGYDGAKRKKGSKTHMAVDTLGHLLALHITPANEQDQTLRKYDVPEPYFLRALALCEKVYGPDHRIVGDAANNIGSFYEEQKRYPEAQRYYQRALDIYGKTLGPEHSDVGIVLQNMANLSRNLGRPAEAEPLYLRSYAIWVKSLGPEHPYVAASLRERGTLCRDTGRWAEAEALYRKALALQEKTSGPTHPSVAEALEEYAKLLRNVGRAEEAGLLEARAKGIRNQTR